MKLQLTLTVDYAPNGTTPELLALTLEQAAEHLCEGNWLAGNTGASVNLAHFRAKELNPLQASTRRLLIEARGMLLCCANRTHALEKARRSELGEALRLTDEAISTL